MRLIQSGPRTTGGILLVGEAPGADEVRQGSPFVGASGWELDKELSASGWSRSAFFFTNVCHERPPGNAIEEFFWKKSKVKKVHLASGEATLVAGRYAMPPVMEGLAQLQRDIDALQPRLILALGGTALWALTGLTGITQWRGSILTAAGGPVDGHGIKLIPTMHPAWVLREMAWKAVVIQDLKRAKREAEFPEVRRPTWNFTVPTTVSEAEEWFNTHVFSCSSETPVVADVENFYEEDRVHDGRLICIGFASSRSDAICLPLSRRASVSTHGPNYWADEGDELAIVQLIRQVLVRNPIIFHNGLHDCQIIAGNYGFMPRFAHDTMVMQHVAFPGMLGGRIDPVTGGVSKKGSSLSLAFCASMYCRYYRHWKNDGRGWDPAVQTDEEYYRYNCEDVIRTYEVWEELAAILRKDRLWEQYLFEMELFEPVFSMMFRGANHDTTLRSGFAQQIQSTKIELQDWIDTALGHHLNVKSSPQMKTLFYGDFQLPPVLHRKTRQPTLDDKALEVLKKRKPLLRPLIERIQLLLSLDTFESNYIHVPLCADGRLRWALNVAGIETFRFSSNPTAFGEGRSLQNLPRDPD